VTGFAGLDVSGLLATTGEDGLDASEVAVLLQPMITRSILKTQTIVRIFLTFMVFLFPFRNESYEKQ
jgi:hypothetical protein